MAALVACLLFFFLFPCLSNPCTPILPCNHSIQINPPFFLQSDNTTCWSQFAVGCDSTNNTSFVIWHSSRFPLESISYGSNITRIQDPYLVSSLKESGCSNLYFNFSIPINDFDHQLYKSLNTSLFSLRCEASNQIHMPPTIFEQDYNLSYSPYGDVDDKSPENCLRPDDSVPYFEFFLSFESDNPEFSLLSATYANERVAQPGCFAYSTEVSNCEGCKEKRFRMRIILGFTGGLAFLLAFCGLSFFFYKRKKLKFASSSSKLLTRRESSDKYFHDLEMPGLEYTQIFSYEELKEATEGFSASKELGDGGFGTVYKGTLKDGRVVAVKRLYRHNYRMAEQFINEVDILSRLHHPNLVTLYGCTAINSHELLLVFEFVPNGTIADHLHGPHYSKNALTWPVRLSIAIETANALAYLHAVEPPIIHRDVKTSNILLDDNFHVKVGDFGLSRLFPLDVTHVSTVPQGTPGYVDPVYHQCYHLTDKSDVYSFGVVLVELISSKQAVDLDRGKDEINLANMALNKIQGSQLDDLVDPDLGFGSNSDIRKTISLVAELAFQCLQSDRDMRPSIKEVLEALRVIEKGNYGVDNKMNVNMTKEETYLLKIDAISSPDTIINSWKSCSTTPNTSG